MHPSGVDPLTGIPFDSPVFRRRRVSTQLSNDPDTATAQTVQEMCRQINQAANDPAVRAIAENAVLTFKGGPGWAYRKDELGNLGDNARTALLAESCFWWCKWNLKFKHHGNMFEVWSGDLGDPSDKLQLLIAPDVLVRMKRMEGDCAIYTMMICAMLKSLGLSYQICPAAVDHRQPQIFSHVFARCNGESLDASHGKYPGWQVPDEDLLRLWVFDENGNRVAEKFQGLHAYRRLRKGRRGMGAQVCDESGCYDDGTGTSPTSVLPDFGPLCPPGMIQSGQSCSFPVGAPSTTPPFVDQSGSPYGGPVYTAPSQNSAQWAAFAASLAKSGLTLAEINSIQPGTVVGANGSILRQNPGYAVPVGSTLGTSLTSLGSSSLLPIGLGLVALLVVGSMFKGGR